MKSLDEIGLKYGTDKSSNGHNYLKYYDQFFSAIRQNNLTILEIGVWEGASLKMWEEYFSFAQIIGADIDEKKQYESERISTVIADQGSVGALVLLGEELINSNGVDIIIDDGSHEAEHQILSFETLFPYLNSGGYYCSEDLLCNFDRTRWGRNANMFDRIRQTVDEVNMGGNIPNHAICANKIEAVKKYNGNYFEKNIEQIHLSCGLAIIKKL